MKEKVFSLNEHELRYVLHFVAHDLLEKRKKLESLQKQVEHIDELFQRMSQVTFDIKEEQYKEEE
jgi:hypothetical protein